MTTNQGKLILPSTPNSVFPSSAIISALSAWSSFIWSLSSQNGVLLLVVYLLSLNAASLTTYLFHFQHTFHPSFLACQTALQSYQACFPFEVIAAQFTARLCGVSQENFWQKPDAEFWSRCGYLHWRDVLERNPAAVFMQVLIQIRALGGFFCFPSLQKISRAYSSLFHKLLFQKLPEK